MGKRVISQHAPTGRAQGRWMRERWRDIDGETEKGRKQGETERGRKRGETESGRKQGETERGRKQRERQRMRNGEGERKIEGTRRGIVGIVVMKFSGAS